MPHVKIRRGGLLAGLFVLSLFAPALLSTSVAAAAECEHLWGSGSSLQGVAQQNVWIPTFTGNKLNFEPCTTAPTVTYTITSSGQALKEWGNTTGVLAPKENGVSTEPERLDGYIATDDAPSETEIKNIGEAGKSGTGSKNGVITFPVTQAAVAEIVTLPEGCETAAKKLTTRSKSLSSIFQSTTGTELTKDTFGSKEGWFGKELSGGGCEIQPKLYVRSKGSGTSFLQKDYLVNIDKAIWSKFVNDNVEWPTTDNSKNTFSGTPDTTYGALPTECSATKIPAPQTGNDSGGHLAENVYSEPGTVGYANLADAVKAGFTLKPTKHVVKCLQGGVTKEHTLTSFYLEVENTEPGTKTPEFASPLGSGGVESNCKEAEYTKRGVGQNISWALVQDLRWNVKGANNYPICGLTYMLVWEHYKFLKYTKAEATKESVKSYLKYIVNTKGQSDIQSNGYFPLPEAIEKEALAGIAQIEL